jgi:hypothetical protein
VLQRCDDAVARYTSREPPAPWASGLERMHPESWDAGTRTVHCFLGQIDGDGEWVPVSVPLPVRR